MKLLKILLPVALFSFLNINALEKPETPDINAETKSLEQDVDALKAQGNLGSQATHARNLETQRLSQRYLELGLKTNKTAAEQHEYKEIGAELKTRVGNAVSKLIPAK